MELLYYWRGPVFPVFPNVNRTHTLVTFSYYLFVCLFTYFLSHHLEGIPEGQQCCWLLHCSASGSPVTLPPTGKYWTTIPRPCAFYALIDITRGALVEMLLCLSSTLIQHCAELMPHPVFVFSYASMRRGSFHVTFEWFPKSHRTRSNKNRTRSKIRHFICDHQSTNIFRPSVGFIVSFWKGRFTKK